MNLKTTEFPKLNITPIKEIVLGMSFDGAFIQEKLDPFTKSEIVMKNLPVCTPTVTNKLVVSAKLQTQSSSATEGWILKNDPTDRVLQVRIGSVSFHIIQKYEPMEKLISELEAYWNELKKNADNWVVTSVFVRYLNLIKIEPGKTLKDYVKIYPNHPFGELNVHGMTNLRFTYQGAEVTIVSSEGEITGQQGVVLDYTIRKKITPKDDNIFDVYHELRNLKNVIFFNSITDQTIKIHQQ